MTALTKEIAEALDCYGDASELYGYGRGQAQDHARREASRAALVAAILAERERLESESEGRRKALLAVGEERRLEWARAERAEEALRAVEAVAARWETQAATRDARAVLASGNSYESVGARLGDTIGARWLRQHAADLRAVLSRIPPSQIGATPSQRDGDTCPESPAKSNPSLLPSSPGSKP